MDVAAIVTQIGTIETAALAIGAAVLLLAVGIKSYKWVRAAL